MNKRTNLKNWVVMSVFLVVLVAHATADGQIIYVDADAAGANDGTSWADAYNYLQDALTDANSVVKPVEIRVAEGTYTPDSNSAHPNGTGDRTATFHIINGVAIKGGYAADPDARDVETYETILSGDLNGDDGANFANNVENSYQVLTGSGTDATAVLDGFIITAGNANGIEMYRYGSGVYNDHGSPALTSCTFRDNWARYGGGMYNGNNSSPTLTNCTFSANWGDGMDNYDSNPTLTSCTFSGNFKGMHNQNSSPTLNNCTFSDNDRGMYNVESSPTLADCTFSGNDGAMSNWGGSSPTLTSCTFSQNSAYNGGGMYNENANPVLTDCDFIGNSANYGGAIYDFNSNPTLASCTFTENSANYHSGAIRNFKSNAVLNNCTFNGNSADGDGGAIGNSQSSPTLTGCTFTANSALNHGGGIYNAASNPTLTDCTFNNNTAYEGAGMYNFDEDPNLTGCTFSWNSADWTGGGMWNTNSSPLLKNCVFSGNSAGSSGGGMENSYNSPVLNNCLFSGNSAGYGGGMSNFNNNPVLTNCTFAGNSAVAISISHFSTLTVTSCIFWGNTGGAISAIDDVTVTVTYSDVHGGWSGVDNINSDPLFVSPGYWADVNDPNSIVEPNDPNAMWVEGDYHLLKDSPCIDAGDPAYVPAPGETDLDGQPRVIGGRIDMGAFEHSLPVPIEVNISPGVINLKSKGKWITTFLLFPEGYDVADIDPNSIVLEDEIEPESVWVDEQEQVVMARFSRSGVQSALGGLEPGDVELTVSGEFSDGTAFEGTDTIRVMDKGKKK